MFFNRVKRQNFWIVLFLFLGIFTPPIGRIQMRFVVTILSILIIGFYTIQGKKLKLNRKVLSIFAVFVPFLVYFIVSEIIRIIVNPKLAGAYFATMRGTLLAFLYQFIICGALMMIINKNKITQERMLKILFTVSNIQLFFVVLTFFVRPIRNIVINQMIANAETDNFISAINRHIDKRIYGFVSNPFDEFGYTISILISVSFLYGMKKNSKIIMGMSLLMLVIPLLNTRTGIVLSVMGITIILLYYFKPKRLLNYIGGIVLVIFIAIILFNRLPEALREWWIQGINWTRLFLTEGDKSSGVFYVLFDADIVFPQDLMFGAGVKSDYVFTSIDNGYIQAIWRYGVVGTILLLMGYLCMFLRCYHNSTDKLTKCLMIVLIAIFFVYFVKLFPVTMFEANILIFGLPTIAYTIKDFS